LKIYLNHRQAVFVYVLSLTSRLPPTSPASEEEERKKSRKLFYVNHGKAVVAFCRACIPRFKRICFSGYQAQLGGRKLLVSLYEHGIKYSRVCSLGLYSK
jgi:hypothetical protein